MEIIIADRYSQDISLEELNKCSKEMEHVQNFINNKNKEITVLKLIDFFKANYLDYLITLSVRKDMSNYFLEVDISESDVQENQDLPLIDNYVFTEEVINLMSLNQDIMGNMYEVFGIENVSFVNNDEERDKIKEFVIGSKWKLWEKEGVVFNTHAKLENEMITKNPVSNKKKKI